MYIPWKSETIEIIVPICWMMNNFPTLQKKRWSTWFSNLIFQSWWSTSTGGSLPGSIQKMANFQDKNSAFLLLSCWAWWAQFPVTHSPRGRGQGDGNPSLSCHGILILLQQMVVLFHGKNRWKSGSEEVVRAKYFTEAWNPRKKKKKKKEKTAVFPKK